jgi:hypothetical protein
MPRGGALKKVMLELKRIDPRETPVRAVVRPTSAGGTQWQSVHSGSSYRSASDLALAFGPVKDVSAIAIEIEWPAEHGKSLPAWLRTSV